MFVGMALHFKQGGIKAKVSFSLSVRSSNNIRAFSKGSESIKKVCTCLS